MAILTPEQEAEQLTQKVLDIRFAYEKVQNQKNDLDAEVTALSDKKTELEKTNADYEARNKVAETALIDLGNQITAKTIEVEQASAVYKDEIDKKFAEIDVQKSDISKREKAVSAKEDTVNKQEADLIQKQRDIESGVLQQEHMAKQNQVKERELDNRSANIDQTNEILIQKKATIEAKAEHLDSFEKSLLERESKLGAKLDALSQMEMSLGQLKTAIDTDRVNLENDKNRNSYVLRALEEIQNWCITNIGKTLTVEIIDSIKKSVLNIAEVEKTEYSVVDKTLLEPATVDPIVEPVGEQIAPVVDSSATVENVSDLLPIVNETTTIENAKKKVN